MALASLASAVSGLAQEDAARSPAKVLRDDLGDPLPQGAVARFGTLRLQDPHEVRAVAFSADGKVLATVGDDKPILLYDAATGLEKLRVEGPGCARDIAFGAEGWLVAVAVGSEGDILGRVGLFNASTGLAVSPGPTAGGRYGIAMRAVAYSPDGKLLAAAGDRKIRFFEPPSPNQVRECEGYYWGGFLKNPLVFSPDGKRLATCCSEAAVGIFSVEKATKLREIEGLPRRGAIAFAPDSSEIATVRSDGRSVGVFEVATGKLERSLVGHRDEVYSVSWSLDGKNVVTAGRDKKIRVFSARTGSEVETHDWAIGDTDWPLGPTAVLATAVSPDRKQLAVGFGRGVRVFELPGGNDVFYSRRHRGPIVSLACSPDGNVLLTVSEQELRAFDTTTHRELWTIDRSEVDGCSGWKAAFSPDGKSISMTCASGLQRLASRTGRMLGATCLDETRLSGPVLAVSPDLKAIALGGEKALRICRDGNPERTVAIERPVAGAAFSPDGKLVATANDDATATVVDVTSSTVLGRVPSIASRPMVAGPVPAIAKKMCAVAFSPDGSTIACGSEEGTLALAAARTGRISTCLEQHAGPAVRAVAFSPDGRFLAAGLGNGTVEVWSVKTARKVFACQGHSWSVESIAFSKDGTRVYSGSEDTTVLEWDVSQIE